MLALFSGAQLANAVGQINFYGIADQLIHEHKSATLWWVTYLNMVSLATYVLFSPLSIWLIEVRGIRASLLLGVLLQLVGSVLQTYVGDHFSYLVIGQTILTIGQPIIVNMSAKVSANWFPKEERVVSTMTSLIFGQIGGALSFVVQLGFVDGPQYRKHHVVPASSRK